MRIWTEEAKQKQRDAIKQWSPWTRSTGPKTPSGKKRSSLNAMKHGFRSAACKRLTIAMRRQRHFIRAIQAQFKTLPKLTNELLSLKLPRLRSGRLSC